MSQVPPKRCRETVLTVGTGDHFRRNAASFAIDTPHAVNEEHQNAPHGQILKTPGLASVIGRTFFPQPPQKPWVPFRGLTTTSMLGLSPDVINLSD